MDSLEEGRNLGVTQGLVCKFEGVGPRTHRVGERCKTYAWVGITGN
jgi:hypothetical protein